MMHTDTYLSETQPETLVPLQTFLVPNKITDTLQQRSWV